MAVLVTGAAGFIGAAVVEKLLAQGLHVIGLDVHNSYYDPALKEARVARFLLHPAYHHVRGDCVDDASYHAVLQHAQPTRIVHLAAQAGVRYSIDNPQAYVHSNLIGFSKILEFANSIKAHHLVYASTSSIYGSSQELPFSTKQQTDFPLSFYAATKKANEAMAHSYSHVHGLPTTGLRFFTVYGPWGRPDMAPFKFARCILEGQPVPLYNQGNHRRDFTYIDDIVEGVVRVLDKPPTADIPPLHAAASPLWRLYNIGNSTPVELLDFLEALENALGKKAQRTYLPMQPGDMHETWADISALMHDFDYRPQISVQDGVERFARWYRDYYYAQLS